MQVIDTLFLQYTVSSTVQSAGASVMLLFAFEFIILTSEVFRYALKYALSMVALCMEGRWESKGTYVFYLELMIDMLHLFVYVVFFVIVMSNYGLPLHLVSANQPPTPRQLWGSMSSRSRASATCIL